MCICIVDVIWCGLVIFIRYLMEYVDGDRLVGIMLLNWCYGFFIS